MTSWSSRFLGLASACVMVTSGSGCAFNGITSLPLPGAVGRGSDAATYHALFSNIATLEPNSPVLIDDVVVGSVGSMRFDDWRIAVDLSLRPGVVVPANARATVGQTSLLGSMHVALDPPPGEAPVGRLPAGATIGEDDTRLAPTTEQTLSSLSVVVNGGGLGKIGDVIHSANIALSGRESDVRDLLRRLDDLLGVVDRQRDRIVATIEAVNRFSGKVAAEKATVAAALQALPPALDVLVAEQPRLTTALERLRVLSDTVTRFASDSHDDLVANLQNLAPTLGALADVGPEIDTALAFLPVFPYGQNTIDRTLRGDYFNLGITLDLTNARVKRTLLLGTRWGEEGAKLVPAPGEPYFRNYSYNPLREPTAGDRPPDAPPQPLASAPAIAPVVPDVPPGAVVTGGAPVFAGPYDRPPQGSNPNGGP